MLRPAMLAACVAVTLGCSKDEHEAAVGRQSAAEAAVPADKLEAMADGDVEAVLAILGRSHADVRHAIGPHRLRYEADFDLAPEGELSALPEVDASVVEPEHVEDELTLQWAEPDEQGPRFRLDQQNDHGRGRSVIVADGMLRSRIHPRPWMEGPMETDVYELWLDDAYGAVHDALAIAAPWLVLEVESSQSGGLSGGASLAFTLGRKAEPDEDLVAPGELSRWRQAMDVSEISGTVVVDATTGAWMSADVTVQYALRGAHGGPVRGSVHLDAKLEPQAPGTVKLQIPQPMPAQPTRVRYEVEKAEILDGLAAP